MKFFQLYIILLIILFNVYHLDAHDDTVHDQLLTVIELSINHRYEVAESLLTQLIRSDDQEPAFYFFMAAVLQSKMMDYEDYRWEHEFDNYIDMCEASARGKIEVDETDKWGYFYLGSALSYRAFNEGKRNNYIGAITHAMKGMSALSKTKQLDPDFDDVYFGLGSYKYWRSKATKYINWLPIIKDERAIGIEMVQRAAEGGELTKYAAINGLTWMLIDDRRVTEALMWAKRGIEKFPTSRFFLWGVAKSYMNLKDYDDAIKYFELIISSFKAGEMNNHYNKAVCYYNLAKAHYELGNPGQSIEYLNLIDTLEVTDATAQRLTNILRRSKNLRKKISG